MANTGNKISANASDLGGGSWSWSISAGDVSSQNDDGIQCTQNNGTNSNNAYIYGCDMSSIPDGSTIDGIIVTVRNSSSGSNQYRENLHLTKDGSNKVGNDAWSHSAMGGWDNTVSGTSTDLWGTTWTAAEIKASTFGVILQTQKTGATARTATIDCVWIDVYYTPPATGKPKHMMHYKKMRAN